MKTITLMERTFVVMAIFALAFQVGCNKKATEKDPPASSQIAPAESDLASSESDDADSAENDTDSLNLSSKNSVPSAGFEFESPIRLKAGDQYVSVESPGYACPTLADVDGDNKLDLVVGQFNEGFMQFCKNEAGEGESPKFAKSEWIMSGLGRAKVPGVW